VSSSARRSANPSPDEPSVRHDKASPVPHNHRPHRRPAALAVVCGLVLVQAGLLAGLASAWVVDLVQGESRLPAATVFLALFALGVAAVLVLAIRGLWAGRRWARSPVMTWQILLVVLSVGWLGVEVAPWAVGVLVSALAVGVGLVLPSVVAVTAERPEA
jgi:hypothetical protein